MRAWTLLRCGNAHDLQGNRQAAQTSYQRLEDHAEVGELAAQYFMAPFTPHHAKLKPFEKVL